MKDFASLCWHVCALCPHNGFFTASHLDDLRHTLQHLVQDKSKSEATSRDKLRQADN